MRTSTTIWESASRPLFVRTVWLEGSELRPGLQRHFLLDYETKRPADHHRAAVNYWQRKRKANALQSSVSYDLEFEDDNPDETLMLIDSAKAKLHAPQKLTNAKSMVKSSSSRRRTSVLSRKFHSYDSYSRHFGPRRTSNSTDYQSRRSSLQDLAAEKHNAPDEKLAERVLNWLDLAGNEDFVKHLSQLKDMEVKLTKTAKLRNDSIKRCLSKATTSHAFQIPSKIKTPKLKAAASFNQEANANQNSCKSVADAVKHITIIFDKEGQPIRFNRPAKNIDLCTLSASPSTTRRLAGSLASARLYKSAETSRLHADHTRSGKLKESGKSLSARRRLDTVADLTNSNLQKRLQENPATSNYHCLHDARKQLHIFMPTLPKKGMATAPGCGTEDGVSELSQNLSEYCKV